MRNSLVAFALLTAAALPTFAQDETKKRNDEAKTSPAKSLLDENPPQERASGVILKVEKLNKDGSVSAPSTEKAKTDDGKSRPTTLRLTINTDAVWADWVRDQTKVNDSGPPRKDAEAGAKSVATTGQPADANSKVVVDVTMDSKIETRFRTPEDSTSRGYKTPEEARGEKVSSKVTKRQAAKPVQFGRDDLKVGLFIEADFLSKKDKNPASIVTVIRPISATAAAPKK